MFSEKAERIPHYQYNEFKGPHYSVVLPISTVRPRGARVKAQSAKTDAASVGRSSTIEGSFSSCPGHA